MAKCTFIGGSKDGDVEEIAGHCKIIEIPVADEVLVGVGDTLPVAYRSEFYKVFDVMDIDGQFHCMALPDCGFGMRPIARLLELYKPTSTVSQMTEMIVAYKIALADSIRRPMGVVPVSAEGLISQSDLDNAERRRATGAIPR